MSTFFFRPWVKTQQLSVGESGTPIPLAAAVEKAVEIYTTSPSIDTGESVQPIYMKSIMAGIGGVGGRACFHMATAVQLGGWANALKGYLELETGGKVTGLGSAVLAELKLPGESLGGIGSYAVSEMELVTQEHGLTGGAPVAFQWMQVSGNQAAIDDWEDNGYFMVIKGLTDNADNIYDKDAGATVKATLRALIGNDIMYFMLADSPTA